MAQSPQEWYLKLKEKNMPDKAWHNIINQLRSDKENPRSSLEKLSYLKEICPQFFTPKEDIIISKDQKPYQVQLSEKYLQLYRSATKRNKEFNLELKDIHKLLQQKQCYYTGHKFEEDGQYKRTVDRIDNSKGYVRGNVVACTEVANQMKEHIFERPTNNAEVNIQFISQVALKVLDHINKI